MMLFAKESKEATCVTFGQAFGLIHILTLLRNSRFAKEPCLIGPRGLRIREALLQKRPIVLRSLLIVATPYRFDNACVPVGSLNLPPTKTTRKKQGKKKKGKRKYRVDDGGVPLGLRVLAISYQVKSIRNVIRLI